MKRIQVLFLIFFIASFSLAQDTPAPNANNVVFEEVYGVQMNLQSATATTICNNVNLPLYDGITLSGYLNVGVSNSASSLGFIFHGAKGKKSTEIVKIPTIIWLNGGPGNDSVARDYLQFGPITVQVNADKTVTLTKVDFAWSDSYNLLFIDQPIDIGAAYAANVNDIPATMEQVAQQFSYALNELFFTQDGCFYKYGLNTKKTPVFLYGQSFAGQYIASIAEKIVKDGNKFNLLGVGLLNAAVSPSAVIDTVSDYAFDQGLINKESYLISQNMAQEIKELVKNQKLAEASLKFKELISYVLPDGKNEYQIDQFNPKKIDVEALMNSQQFKDLYKFDKKDFKESSANVVAKLGLETMKENTVSKYNYLLSQNINVQVIAGDRDLVVPYTSALRWISQLSWADTITFQKQDNKIITNTDKVKIGTSQKYKNLALDIVFGAGHFIPLDKPESVKYFLDNAIQGVMQNQIEVVEDNTKKPTDTISHSTTLIVSLISLIYIILF